MKFVTGILWLVLTGWIAGCSGEESIQKNGIGALEKYVALGESDGWSATLKDGIFWLNNAQAEGAIRYYFTPYTDGDGGARSIGVDVNVAELKPDARAGLLYGYQADPRLYYLMLLGPAGALDVYRRDGNGLQMTMSQSITLSKSGYNRIEVHEQGRSVEISVNGQSAGSFESQGTGRGSVGIAALGIGRSGFTNYYQSNAPVDKAPGAVSQAAETPANSTSVEGKPLVLKDVIVRDEGRKNFPAYQFLVPENWTLVGSVKHPGQHYYNIPYTDDITITAPDGRFVHFYPFMEFGYNDQARGQALQAFDGRFFLRTPESMGQFWSLLAKLDPGQQISNIEIVSEEMLADATQLARQRATGAYEQARLTTEQGRLIGQRMIFDTQVRQLVVRYDLNGTRLEETLIMPVQFTTVLLPNGSVKGAMWSIANVLGVGGPVGRNHMDDPQLATVLQSKRVNLDWAYTIDRWHAGQRERIIEVGIARAAAEQRSWKNTRVKDGEDILDISFNGWKKRTGMRDAGQANEVDMVHERTTYATSADQNVHLPSYYQNAFQDGQGNFVLHNDANYQINTDPAFNSHNWDRMEPLRR